MPVRNAEAQTVIRRSETEDPSRLFMPLAWITGAGGLIGNYLVRWASAAAPQWTVIGLTRDQLDLLDLAAVRERFAAEKPSLVIHCAARSRSGDCQADPATARRINVEATQWLAELARDGHLIFFSSDLVFDGQQGHYSEPDAVNPLSVYGETKVLAEQIVLANPRHTVIRTSLNAGQSPTGNRGFNEEMRQAWKSGQTLRLFVDEYRSPLPAVITAEMVWKLVQKQTPGLFHLAGSERISRWEIGRLLASRWPGLETRIEPASLKEFTGPPRPPDTSLNCDKLEALLGCKFPGFSQWLKEHPAERL